MQISENRRVVITGMGIVAPGAKDLLAYKNLISQGKNAIEHLPDLEEYGLRCQLAGVARRDKEKYKEIFEYNDLESTGDIIEIACHAGLDAWTDAGLKIPDFEDSNTDWDCGMILGSGIPNLEFIVKNISKAISSKTIKTLTSETVASTMGSGPAAHLSAILGISNQVTANASACCTGTESIIDSFYKIKFGLAEKMIAGATEGFSIATCAIFDAARVTNRKFNDFPETASRPMSASGKGFIPSSGAGVLVLESLASAEARGARIYAEILGGAVNSGGQRNGGSMSFPNNEGVKRCITSALKRAQINLEDVDLINGHLNGTKADVIEIKNWVDVFTHSEKGFPYINSTKSMIGHLLGAAGAAESIASILQLYHGFIHPSINCEDLNEDIADILPKERIPQKKIEIEKLNIIIKGSFGYGDANAVIIFKKWPN